MKRYGVLLSCLIGLGSITGYAIASDSATTVAQTMTLQQQIDSLELGKATLNEILARFGEPQAYYDSDMIPYKREQIRNGEQLPGWYVMPYHNDKLVFSMLAGKLSQVQVMEAGYTYKSISVGSSIDQVFDTFGKPEDTYEFNPINKHVATKKTIMFRYTAAGTQVKLYLTDAQRLGFYMVDDKVVTIVRNIN